jgi:malate dehydrogenase
MSTVAVLGAGEIGGATACALAASGEVHRVVIVDAVARIAAGKALDIQQAGAIAGFHTRLEGTDDLTRLIGCAVCVVADASGQSGAGDPVEHRLTTIAEVASSLSGLPIVFANPDDGELIERAARELGISRRRLLGSAPEAFRSALRAIIAVEADCSPAEVSLAVLGRPPRDLVIPWSDVSLGGHRLSERLEPVQVTRLERGVARLWPPGPYALGLAAARMALAIVGSSRRPHSVLTVLDGEFGVKRRVGIIPARLSPAGIARTWVPPLSSRESVQVMSALAQARVEG